MESLENLDSKHSNNYTHIKIEGECLNLKREDKEEKLFNLPIADTDILIVETENKDGDFVFTPEGEEVLDDPLQKPVVTDDQSYEGLNLVKLFKNKSSRGLCGL